jgi:hypothetical protein
LESTFNAFDDGSRSIFFANLTTLRTFLRCEHAIDHNQFFAQRLSFCILGVSETPHKASGLNHDGAANSATFFDPMPVKSSKANAM